MNNFRNDYAYMIKTTKYLDKHKHFLYRNLTAGASEYKETPRTTTPQCTMIMKCFGVAAATSFLIEWKGSEHLIVLVLTLRPSQKSFGSHVFALIEQK
jgi:hypothetical protein